MLIFEWLYGRNATRILEGLGFIGRRASLNTPRAVKCESWRFGPKTPQSLG